MIKNTWVIALWCFISCCGCSEVLDYDQKAAMKDDALRAILNAGYRYDKGVHYLDNEVVLCSFFACDDAAIDRVIALTIRQGWTWADVASARGTIDEKDGWKYAFVRGNERLLLRNDKTKIEVMLIGNDREWCSWTPRSRGKMEAPK